MVIRNPISFLDDFSETSALNNLNLVVINGIAILILVEGSTLPAGSILSPFPVIF